MTRVASAALMLALTLAASGPAAADQWQKSYPITGRPGLQLETGDAHVRVSAWDRKEIGITVVTEGYSISDRGVRVAVERDGDQIRCAVREPHFTFALWGFHRYSIQVEVSMPKAADLDVRGADGMVELGALSGSVHVHTADGRIVAEGLKGDVVLETSDGAIQATGLDGAVATHTADGRTTLEGRFDRLDTRAGDGRVEITALDGSRIAEPWRVRAADGSVTLRLPRSFAATLDLTSHDGSIHLGMPILTRGEYRRSHLIGDLNGGGSLVGITSSGSIHVDPL